MNELTIEERKFQKMNLFVCDDLVYLSKTCDKYLVVSEFIEEIIGDVYQKARDFREKASCAWYGIEYIIFLQQSFWYGSGLMMWPTYEQTKKLAGKNKTIQGHFWFLQKNGENLIENYDPQKVNSWGDYIGWLRKRANHPDSGLGSPYEIIADFTEICLSAENKHQTKLMQAGFKLIEDLNENNPLCREAQTMADSCFPFKFE